MVSLCVIAVPALTACGERAERFVAIPASGDRSLAVTSADGTPFTFADGAKAKRQADARCGGGVKTSIYDRFDAARAAWVFPEGCA